TIKTRRHRTGSSSRTLTSVSGKRSSVQAPSSACRNLAIVIASSRLALPLTMTNLVFIWLPRYTQNIFSASVDAGDFPARKKPTLGEGFSQNPYQRRNRECEFLGFSTPADAW